MSRKRLLLILTIGLFLLLSSGISGHIDNISPGQQNKNAVSLLDQRIVRINHTQDSSIAYLGNPFSARYPNGSTWEYARNVWDMHEWHGKIYFGHGDVVRNAGPIDLWYYDISQENFINEFSVADEQIYRFREFNNTLYIPGYDATESWDFGNFYANTGAGWLKYRTIPNEIHVTDIFVYHDTLFAAGNRGVYASVDGGSSWHHYKLGGWELFSLNDELYLSRSSARIYRLAGNEFVQENVTFFPGIAGGGAAYVYRSVNFNNELIYLCINASREAIGIFRAPTIHQAAPIDFFASRIPRDIIKKDSLLFVMTSTKWGNDYLTEFFSTADLEKWEKEFEVITPSFVRSFEYSAGSFYISLGSDESDEFCGDIFRITPAYSDANFPAKTATSAPPNLGFSKTQTPTLIWRSAHRATAYSLQYSTREDFDSSETVIVELTDTSYTLPVPLPEYAIVFWHVRSENEHGQSDYSTTASFMIHAAYQVPTSLDGIIDSTTSAKLAFLNNGQLADENRFTLEYPKGSGLNQLFIGEIWAGGYTAKGTTGIFGEEYGSPWIPTRPFAAKSYETGMRYSCQFSDEITYTRGAGISISQNIYSLPDEDYAILEYTLHNTGRNGRLENLYWAIFLDFEIASSREVAGLMNDLVGYDSLQALSYMYDNLAGDSTKVVYAGVAALNQTPATHRHWGWDDQILYTPAGIYEAMASNIIQTPPESEMDYKIMQAIGPFELEPKDSVTVAVALVWGRGLDAIQNASHSARQKYSQITSILNASADVQPTQFYLFPNYPNPFNAATTIRFQLAQTDRVRIKIFDLLGRQVFYEEKSLVSGVHAITWDSKNTTSGLYLCVVQSGEFKRMIKMMLIR